ncbi:GNAT family N-acetyltransferase [Natronoglycomyces albus]|uniref:N-acetyltransferase n=1 Tax=Natronoglycomyces albus TaxID=2811108 RepID=A0A895XPC8_9ACTN|nr:GNAT family N-acetyltransferase [Natronoglycomyces albus]QSB05602.1 N-acetyltransferase [Natronoglycomyces albus]
MSESSINIRKNAAASRFEAWDGESLIGQLDFDKQEKFTLYPHTEVDPAYRGQGLANQLAEAAFADLRAQGGMAYPQCPFVAKWLSKHPEYADLDARGHSSD